MKVCNHAANNKSSESSLGMKKKRKSARNIYLMPSKTFVVKLYEFSFHAICIYLINVELSLCLAHEASMLQIFEYQCQWHCSLFSFQSYRNYSRVDLISRTCLRLESHETSSRRKTSARLALD